MKNKYLGKWIESGAKEINLPFTSANLKLVLQKAATGTDHTHQDIAGWCRNYTTKHREEERDMAYEVAEDVDAQWDLFLFNTYTLPELQNLDCSKVELQKEWFENWLNKLG